MTNPIPNSVAIFGNSLSPIDVALRSILKFRESISHVIVLDYTGRGAMVLGPNNKMSLLNHPINWYDIADRYHPSALFQLHRSDHFKIILF